MFLKWNRMWSLVMRSNCPGSKAVFPILTKFASDPGHLQKQSTNPRVSAPFSVRNGMEGNDKKGRIIARRIIEEEVKRTNFISLFGSRGFGEGSEIDFMCHANTDLLVAFHCDRQVSHSYKYKFLRATTSNIPSSVIRDNRGSKLTIGRGGMLKVQHLVSVAKPAIPHPHVDSSGYQQPSRIAYIEFFVKPEVDDADNANDT
ncbi:hypothetical protein T459_00908 [Capsicum annuum]|uniref:Uncharacterized protein n=1 Tax=Capsicum annuum TaxID=4072 RepID=A0A2G3AFL3_CAPAN|nr:hypothetical protein T459_00908 [Capsicum annuum]